MARRSGLPTAHNFLRNSGYISTWGSDKVESFEELQAYADKNQVTEFIVLNDAEINFKQWHFSKIDGQWIEI